MIQEIDPDNAKPVSIGSGRVVEIDVASGMIRVHLKEDYQEVAVPSLAGDHRSLQVWSDDTSDAVLFVRHRDKAVTRVDVRNGLINEVGLGREPDASCVREEFVESDLGPLLIYERGVIAMNHDGTVRWKAIDLANDDFAEAVRESTVSYIGRDGDRWRYDLRSGSRHDS